MDTKGNLSPKPVEIFDFPNTHGRYCLEFDRREALPPDEVSAIEGLACGHALLLGESAVKLYDLEPKQSWRVLDLGCGVGTFLVGAIAGSESLPIEIVGIDNDVRVLEYADSNLARAVEASKSIYPNRQIGHTLLQADWNDPSLWQSIGQFDYIFSNPPYLEPGEPIREPGYELVPPRQMYGAGRQAEYQDLWARGFENLLPLGTLAIRDSSRRSFRLPLTHFIEQIFGGYDHNGSKQQYTSDRSGYIEKFTKLPDDWPPNRPVPYNDPRLRILLSTGKDIGKI